MLNKMIQGESCMFAGTRSAKLLFPAKTVRKVYNSVLGVEYCEGKDWICDRKSGTVELPPDSAIPHLTQAELHPANAKLYPDPDANAVTGGPDAPDFLFSAKLFFAEHQIEVDYEPEYQDWQENSFERSPFFRNTPIRRLVTLGDSITEGFNASGYIGRSPFRPPYPGLVAQALGAELFNYGCDGTSCCYLPQVEEKAIAANPDLLTISYGMNDLRSLTPEQYIAQISKAADRFREALPQTQLMLISPMSGNPEWFATPVENTRRFAAALKEYAAAEKLIFADVFKVWTFAAERKGFMSLTGNGVNHPNDFGHALYARTILAALSR